MGAVGTIYTAIGGMRSVIWTDVFQFMMLYGGITVVLIMAGVEIGSLSKIFSLADEGKRIRFDIISGDPRVRHTVWGCIINGLFNSLPNFFGQSSIQRISSIKIQKDAERSALLNIPISMFFILVLQLTGISVFAYFSSHQCDPLESGQIENPNQLVPFFVMNVLSSTPGLTGIFLAAMFSASLSSLSSGISSLTANTLQDLLPYCLKNVTQTRKTAYAKLIALCYGCAVVGVAYLLRRLHGPVGQITAVAVGSTGGPAVGLFLLGATSPFPDWVAALVGGVVGVAFTAYLSITTTLYRQPDVTSAPISTSGCFPEVTLHNNVSLLHDTYGNHTTDNSATTTLASRLSGVPFSLYDISYVYIGMVGTIVTFLVGLSVTFCIVCIRKNRTRSHCSSHLLFPFMRRFWNSSTQHKSKNELGHKMRVEVDEEVTAVEQNESKVESVKL
ncbi:sodium-coupled monocarboxylate transporter 2-like [Mya arenaria]|uniref:sodium-coupled monocarboxylate transporter 2-like n=1 Tax=Mya arenaria TaxID=6604 RepID=UPI0022DEF04E|nr:sodium-coupled monocarboxylate transporter 2-like [Mya arenaria]